MRIPAVRRGLIRDGQFRCLQPLAVLVTGIHQLRNAPVTSSVRSIAYGRLPVPIICVMPWTSIEKLFEFSVGM